MFSKNPEQNKKLSNIIGMGTSSGVIIAALLERLEQRYNTAKNKSDDAKAQIKKVRCDSSPHSFY
jgi:methylase of polypeptide subunit release factors